jgi:diguanylate cyclase (GGDEF)-like protein/PAS domain S-box-containing protein
MRCAARLVGALTLLSCAPLAHALDPKKEIGAYVLDQWDARHGLSFNTVRSIRQTPDGYLWLGTQSGLVRFDGLHFSVFDVQNTPELGHNHLWGLAVEKDGSLWIATNGGLSRWQDGRIVHQDRSRLKSETLRALGQSRDGTLWIGSANGGLTRWGPDSPRTYTTADGLSSDSIFSIAEDLKGALWVGTNRGLDLLEGGAIRHLDVGNVLVWSLLVSRDGTVWVGTEGRGLWRFKDGEVRHFTTAEGLPGNEVRALLEDRDGNLWVGTNYGLGRLTDGRFSQLASAQGLPSDLVRSIHEDADGSLWVGFYGGGLTRLRDGEFTSLGTRDGLVHDLTWGVGEGADGSLWITTHAGISHLVNGRWTSYTTADGLSDNITRPVHVDRMGRVWVGANHGLNRLQGSRWTRPAAALLGETVVQAIYEARDGALWVGTWDGLFRLAGDHVDAYRTGDPVRDEIRAVLEDRKGTIWVGGARGVARVQGGRLVPFQPDAPWWGVSVEAIHEDRAGVLWVGTDGAGLFRIEGDRRTAITTREGLFDDTVFHVLEDDDGDLWMGGPRGVFRVSQASLADFTAGRSPRVSGTVYGVAHGMKSSECTGGGSQPGAFKDRQGRLWFPTNKGVVMIDPRRVSRVVPPPVVHIEEVRLDREALATRGAVEAGPGNGDLEIRYAAVSFISAGSVRFRYRLEGFDGGWVEAADRRVAHYANLLPGRYRFVVTASNDGVAWSATGSSVELALRPRFYQTRLFRAASVLGIAVIGLALHRLRIRRLARRAAALVRINEALHESEERYAVAARGANDGLWDWNLKSGRVYYSPRWKSMLGHLDQEVSDRPSEWLDRIHPDDRARVQADLDAHLEGASPHFECEHRIRHRDGSYRFVLIRGLVIRDEAGARVRVAGSQTDITARKQAEARILHDALHDPLTGLPNRTLYLDRLGQALARRRRREQYHFAVLFLDLDRFKLVNDSLGHLAGDALLVGLARRLAACLRHQDTVARLGGDEFAILLDDIDDTREATRVVERIQEELRNPFVLDGHEVFSTASIGITFGGPEERTPDELLRDADTAMYRAKALGRDRHEIFDAAMHARAVAALTLETDLRRGLERGELRLAYQPIVSLEGGGTVGLEALVRWRHPERGLLTAAEFIPLAEETGLIVPVGHWVMEEACRAASAARDRGVAPLPISVNLCAREFTQPDLPSRMRGLLDRYGLGADCIRVEITESLIMEDPEAAVARCLTLREMGVGIEIDDFGTGYSSLSSLRRFPVDALKIDRSFVVGVHERQEDTEIVRAIVSLAAALELGVVAEGVETTQQADALLALGCPLAQGYLFVLPPDLAAALAPPAPVDRAGPVEP